MSWFLKIKSRQEITRKCQWKSREVQVICTTSQTVIWAYWELISHCGGGLWWTRTAQVQMQQEHKTFPKQNRKWTRWKYGNTHRNGLVAWELVPQTYSTYWLYLNALPLWKCSVHKCGCLVWCGTQPSLGYSPKPQLKQCSGLNNLFKQNGETVELFLL